MVIHPDYPFPVRKFYNQEGVEIAYMDVGEGELTLVFLHGFASFGPVWTHNLEVLKKYFRCLCLDLPGHGLSSKKDFAYSQSFYTSVVLEWIGSLQIKPFVLIGHSMGGQIAIRLTAENPGLVSHLALVAPAGFERFSEQEKILLMQYAGSGILGASQYLKLIFNFKNYFYHLNEKEFEKLKELNRDFYSLVKNERLPLILSRTVKGMLDEPVYPLLEKLHLPVLVLFGKNDRLIPNSFLHPTATTEKIARDGCQQIPDVRLKIYEECGHFLPYEYPAKFNIDLYKFLHPRIFL